MTLTMLVLPLPFGPTSPKISPCPISKPTPLSARNPPNASSMSRHCRTASLRGCAARLIASHPEHAVMRPVDRRIQRDADRNAKRIAGIDGIQNAIVPQFGGGIIGALVAAVFLQDRIADCVDLIRRKRFARARQLPHLDVGKHIGGLLGAH